jgi:subtilase-type serine protease
MYGKKNKWLKATIALSAYSCGGVMAADLTVSSGNTQVLDGSVNYPGGVDVNGGTLVIGGNGGGSGVALTGSVNANSNGTVAGYGSITGDLNVSGAHVAPGYSVGTPTGVSNGNLVVGGNLSMNNAVFDFETGFAGPPITQPGTGDNLTVRGNATLNNTTLNVSVNTPGTNVGYYRILSYGGTLNGGFTMGAVTGVSQPAATIQTLTGDKQINLILGPSTTNLWNGDGVASSTRSGGGSGTWSAASTNWNSPTNATGALPDGGYAIFTGATGVVTVDGSAGPVRASGLQFATDRYHVQGAPITLVASGGSPPAIVVGDGTYASGQFVDTIDNSLQGTDGFVKTGPGSIILTGDSSGLSGPIFIADGALEIDGKLNGPLLIAPEVVLAGVGQVGSTTFQPGGVLSPGNDASPIGNLTVNGDLTFAQNTIYRVHADPLSSASDHVHVTGVAHLDGSVEHVGPDGNYAPLTTYNILTADGGIQGQFTGATTSYAFLTPTLSYDAKNAFLTLSRNGVPIGSVGNTGNQGSVGGALDNEAPPVTGTAPAAPATGTAPAAPATGTAPAAPATGSSPAATGSTAAANGTPPPASGVPASGVGSALAGTAAANTGASQVATAVLTMTPEQAHAALNVLSGEAYASNTSILQSLGDTVRTLPMDHLRGNLDAHATPGRPTAQLGSPLSDAQPQSGAYPVWAQVFGDWRTFKSDGNASRVSQSDGGLFVGGDGAVGNGWRLGGALGYIGSHSSISNVSARTDVDSYTATIFGGRNFYVGPGHFRFTAGTAYTWHDIKTKRDVEVGSLNQNLDSSYNASSTQVFTELGYNLPLGDAYTVEPFAGVAWNQLRTRDFNESGGSAALHGDGQTDDVTSTTMGLRGTWSFGADRTPGRLTASLGWRHAMGDVNPTQAVAFQGGSSFTVAGVPIARDAGVVGLGAEMNLTRNTTAGISYDAQFGGGNKQQSGVFKLAVRF